MLARDVLVFGCSMGGYHALMNLIPRIEKSDELITIIIPHVNAAQLASSLPKIVGEKNLIKVRQKEEVIHGKTYLYFRPIWESVGMWPYKDLDGRLYLEAGGGIEWQTEITYFIEKASEVFLDRMIVSILSGNGYDGSEALTKAKNHGSINIAHFQKEYSGTITNPYHGSMPRCARDTGAIHLKGDIPYLSKSINMLVAGKTVEAVKEKVGEPYFPW